MKKRIISLMLTVCLLCSAIPAVTMQASALSWYSASALDYGAAHWNDGVGLCAEFVSKCVQAGGIAMPTKTGTGGVWKTLTQMTGLPMLQLGLDAKGNATQGLNGDNLQAGDVVVQYCNTHQIAPHIMLCAGFDSAGRAVYYAHNGAMNRGLYDLSVNLAYQHTTACDMGGRVIPLHQLEAGTPAVVTPTFSAAYSEKPHMIQSDDAQISTTLSVSGAAISEVDLVGIELYNGKGTQKLNEKAESPDSVNGVINMWYNIKKELGVTLSPNTYYQYRFLARIRGQVYFSDMRSFTTGPDFGVYVKLDPNGGTGGTKGIKIGYGCLMGTVAITAPTREGYKFEGWAYKPNGSNLMGDNTSFSENTPTTLYAHWSKDSVESTAPQAPARITVYYDAQGGTCDTKAEITSSGNTLSLPTPTRYGYLFEGWYTDAAHGSKRVDGNTAINVNYDITLYARWKALGYTFPFTDIFADDWYRNDVQNAHKLGLISGKTATEYRPHDLMTVAEAIKLAACMHQKYHTGAVTLQNGKDVWYSTYVEYAKQNGIPWNASNYNGGITRQAYVYVFYYALPASTYTQINSVRDNAIPDVKMDATYASQIYDFYRAGILTGSDAQGTFNPKTGIRRSEVATILSRMMDASTRKSITLG